MSYPSSSLDNSSSNYQINSTHKFNLISSNDLLTLNDDQSFQLFPSIVDFSDSEKKTSQPNQITNKQQNQVITKTKTLPSLKNRSNRSKFEINTIISLLRSFNGNTHKVFNLYPNMSIEEIESIKKSNENRIFFRNTQFSHEEDRLLIDCISIYGEKYNKIVRIFKGKKSITEIKWRYKKLLTMNLLLKNSNSSSLILKNDDEKKEVMEKDLIINKNFKDINIGHINNKSFFMLNRKNDKDKKNNLLSKKRKGVNLYNNLLIKENLSKNNFMYIFYKLDILYKTYLLINEFISKSTTSSSLPRSKFEYKKHLLNQVHIKFEYKINTYKRKYMDIFHLNENDKSIIIDKIEILIEINQLLKMKEKLMYL